MALEDHNNRLMTIIHGQQVCASHKFTPGKIIQIKSQVLCGVRTDKNVHHEKGPLPSLLDSFLSYILLIRPSSDRTYYGMVMSVRHSFLHFSPTCFKILSWNFVCHFLFMKIRSSSSVVNIRQFLLEICPFWIFNSWKCTAFLTFLLHTLTYWAAILHMPLLSCTRVLKF